MVNEDVFVCACVRVYVWWLNKSFVFNDGSVLLHFAISHHICQGILIKVFSFRVFHMECASTFITHRVIRKRFFINTSMCSVWPFGNCKPIIQWQYMHTYISTHTHTHTITHTCMWVTPHDLVGISCDNSFVIFVYRVKYFGEYRCRFQRCKYVRVLYASECVYVSVCVRIRILKTILYNNQNIIYAINFVAKRSAIYSLKYQNECDSRRHFLACAHSFNS